MTPSELLTLAGDAAQILEDELGLTAVARLREGEVRLECWGMLEGKQVVVRQTIGAQSGTARAIALACAAAIKSSGAAPSSPS